MPMTTPDAQIAPSGIQGVDAYLRATQQQNDLAAQNARYFAGLDQQKQQNQMQNQLAQQSRADAMQRFLGTQSLDQARLQQQGQQFGQDIDYKNRALAQTGDYQKGELANRNTATQQQGEYQKGELAARHDDLIERGQERQERIRQFAAGEINKFYSKKEDYINSIAKQKSSAAEKLPNADAALEQIEADRIEAMKSLAEEHAAAHKHAYFQPDEWGDVFDTHTQQQQQQQPQAQPQQVRYDAAGNEVNPNYTGTEPPPEAPANDDEMTIQPRSKSPQPELSITGQRPSADQLIARGRKQQQQLKDDAQTYSKVMAQLEEDKKDAETSGVDSTPIKERMDAINNGRTNGVPMKDLLAADPGEAYKKIQTKVGAQRVKDKDKKFSDNLKGTYEQNKADIQEQYSDDPAKAQALIDRLPQNTIVKQLEKKFIREKVTPDKAKAWWQNEISALDGTAIDPNNPFSKQRIDAIDANYEQNMKRTINRTGKSLSTHLSTSEGQSVQGGESGPVPWASASAHFNLTAGLGQTDSEGHAEMLGHRAAVVGQVWESQAKDRRKQLDARGKIENWDEVLGLLHDKAEASAGGSADAAGGPQGGPQGNGPAPVPPKFTPPGAVPSDAFDEGTPTTFYKGSDIAANARGQIGTPTNPQERMQQINAIVSSSSTSMGPGGKAALVKEYAQLATDPANAKAAQAKGLPSPHDLAAYSGIAEEGRATQDAMANSPGSVAAGNVAAGAVDLLATVAPEVIGPALEALPTFARAVGRSAGSESLRPVMDFLNKIGMPEAAAQARAEAAAASLPETASLREIGIAAAKGDATVGNKALTITPEGAQGISPRLGKQVGGAINAPAPGTQGMPPPNSGPPMPVQASPSLPPPLNVNQGQIQPVLGGLQRQSALAGQLANTPTEINPATNTALDGVPMSELEATPDQLNNAEAVLRQKYPGRAVPPLQGPAGAGEGLPEVPHIDQVKAEARLQELKDIEDAGKLDQYGKDEMMDLEDNLKGSETAEGTAVSTHAGPGGTQFSSWAAKNPDLAREVEDAAREEMANRAKVPMNEESYVKAVTDSVKKAHKDKPAVVAKLDKAAREEFKATAKAQSRSKIAMENNVAPEVVQQVESQANDMAKAGPGQARGDMDPEQVTKISEALKKADSSPVVVPENGTMMIDGKEHKWVNDAWVDASGFEAPNVETIDPNTGSVAYKPRPGPQGEPVSAAVPAPAEAQAQQGMRRLYHGEADAAAGDKTSPRWFTTDPKYAAGYAKKSGGRVSYIDVPEDHPMFEDWNFENNPTWSGNVPAKLAGTRTAMGAAATKTPQRNAGDFGIPKPKVRRRF